jgi:hypothetical protein
VREVAVREVAVREVAVREVAVREVAVRAIPLRRGAGSAVVMGGPEVLGSLVGRYRVHPQCSASVVPWLPCAGNNPGIFPLAENLLDGRFVKTIAFFSDVN